MLKTIAITIASAFVATSAQALPSDWRNPETDAMFAKHFSPSENEAFKRNISGSESGNRAVEAAYVIARLLEDSPEKVYDLAAVTCDERSVGVPRILLVNAIVRSIRATKSKMHPLTARYFGEQLTNVAIRSYCPTLKE